MQTEEPVFCTEKFKRYLPIEDYAVIGDCRCAALISKYGSIDWLCLPRFDSDAVFGAMLDTEKGGCHKVAPIQKYVSGRRYIEDTNVLETRFSTATGQALLTDLMPVYDLDYMRRNLCPERHLLRKIEVLEGEMEIEVLYKPRGDYGRIIPKLQDRGLYGLYHENEVGAFIYRSNASFGLSGDRSEARKKFVLQKGRRIYFSLVYSATGPAVLPFLGDQAENVIEQTLRWWKKWASKCTFQGDYRQPVVRSLLALKLLSFSPSGAVIAAPTTSLPEKIGGMRNWDYRFCWLRDAAMTVRALFSLGYHDEAEAFLAWLLHSTRLSRPKLQVVYDVYGETRIREEKLPDLDGYASSRPVRIGNDARNQLQMDIYGEVVAAAFEFLRHRNSLDRQTRRMLKNIGNVVASSWRDPDQGIWELRTGRRHNTYSKAMCWVTLDLLVRMHRMGFVRVPVKQYIAERDAIRSQIENLGFDQKSESYLTSYGKEAVDGSLLLLPIYGYRGFKDKRIVSTCKRIAKELGKNGLIYRYLSEDGLPHGEGAFGACSFWAVECEARRGEIDMAHSRFDRLLSYANEVGLFSEEIDAESGAALGNFPQAFTHVALINAAIALCESKTRKKRERT